MEITLLHEFNQLRGNLSSIGLALVDFTNALDPVDLSDPYDAWRWGKSGWTRRPHNFISVGIRYQRANRIGLSLRGSPDDFEERSALPLRVGRGQSYSRCYVDFPRQLDAAACYIRRALELFREGKRHY